MEFGHREASAARGNPARAGESAVGDYQTRLISLLGAGLYGVVADAQPVAALAVDYRGADGADIGGEELAFVAGEGEG